ncbi:carbamoyltransferase HypF [Risungbinella massiliensis]|uniref:carbamoyltransferase HypF n=1 Tax=Risungbinella massiliensis TaxID=1329796 RepID=UPI0005CC7B8B|nr:carbamoyltransferase HypF [Risungbinella massiliensis]
MYKALEIKVSGRVQGVGFRPFVYSLANKYHLTGIVQNNLDSVTILVEGDEKHLVKMVKELESFPPPLSKIDEININRIPRMKYKDFTIVTSKVVGDSVPRISGDAAICVDCLEELNNPYDRRFQYPFINCTQCGPRYTIINRLPYDRPNTTMREFAMCPNCQQEYDDPANRRHHAQPICCPDCGPSVMLCNQNGEILAENYHAIRHTVDFIKQGNIIGIKGLGGYHLACDPTQVNVVKRLRAIKNRPQRPLAIMVNSIETVKQYCHVSSKEEELLQSPQMPIVILNKKSDCSLPNVVSPGLSTLGIMLPYTPLHYLLLEESDLECLVMTSANPSGFPIQYKDESQNLLQEMCDYILTHNRKIHVPIDDSVVQTNGQNILYLRRARGFAPEPIKTKSQVNQIIALGGNQKNTFSVGKNDHIVMSPHIGDLDNEEMTCYFKEQLHHYKIWLGLEEKYIAVDQHPFYTTTSIAEKSNSKVISIQHHHAHHVSCMEDNGLKEPCIGIILDGTGYGLDGNIWGFEFLYGNASSFQRLAHLEYTPLPGGEIAVKEPWRNAVGMLLHYWSKEGKILAKKLFTEKFKEIDLIERMISNNINTPMAGTCGRLFDAVSAILGICLTSTYEGEAAVKLADYMNENQIHNLGETYSFHLETNCKNPPQLNLSPMLYQIIQEKLNHQSTEIIIRKFHNTIVLCCLKMICKLVEMKPDLNRTVVLSGGSFQNMYLAQEIPRYLEKEGFTVYTHKKVPCHDGGLSLGQIVIAADTVMKSTSDSERGANICV